MQNYCKGNEFDLHKNIYATHFRTRTRFGMQQLGNGLFGGTSKEYSGAPNENIVQNHLNIALLNVF